MTQKPFTPKGEEVIRQEIIADFGLDPEVDINKEIIDKAVARELKSEQMKASLHDSKEKKKKTIAELEEKLKGTAPKGDNKDTKPKGEDNEAKTRQLVAEEMFINSGGTNTELRQIKKIMAATGKSFRDAQKDSLFVAFQEKQEREQTSRSSQLPPARGGTPKPKTDDDKIADKNMGNLPPGFSAEESKK